MLYSLLPSCGREVVERLFSLVLSCWLENMWDETGVGLRLWNSQACGGDLLLNWSPRATMDTLGYMREVMLLPLRNWAAPQRDQVAPKPNLQSLQQSSVTRVAFLLNGGTDKHKMRCFGWPSSSPPPAPSYPLSDGYLLQSLLFQPFM